MKKPTDEQLREARQRNWVRQATGKTPRGPLNKGPCMLCGKPEPSGKSLALDHCHVTGWLRGWLCFRCNVALGLFNDDPDLLRRAAEYIDMHKPK